MRVALDLTALVAQPTGVDRYLMGLVSGLVRVDHGNQYVLLINRDDRARVEGELASASPSGAPPSNVRLLAWCRRSRAWRIALQQVVQPPLAKALRVDVLHSATFIMPLWRAGLRHLLTIHDMTSFLTPQHHARSRRGRLYEWAVSGSIRRADLVTVPAPTVREDILRLVPGVPPARIGVTPYGVDDAFRPRSQGEIRDVQERLRVPTPYVLYVGTLDPRKNLQTLVDAYARLVTGGDVPEHLVLAGQSGWSTGELMSRISASPVRERIHLLGYVPEVDLPGLYGGARLFVYPSWLEGFGFPPLEAMATGVPVVASSSSALSDNLDGAALLVPPGDPDRLAAAMRELLTDQTARRFHTDAGQRRAAAFRWDVCARRTLACYEDLCDRSPWH